MNSAPTKIDWNQPIELVDDTRKVTVMQDRTASFENGAEVMIEGDAMSRTYRADGRHFANRQPRIRNVVPTIDVTGPLQTRDGKKARYIGKLDNGQLLFGITYAGYTGHEATELRHADGRKSAVTGHTSGDDIVAKIVERVTYQNVYADGTVGSTKHGSEDDARNRTKYGRVRIGVLKTTFHNDVRVSAVVNSSVIGWYRSAACPKGREATREDYARG